MLKLTERDIKMKEIVKDVIVADTNTISIIFFNGSKRAVQQRLKLLAD